jgi:GT2 family glycosyltransferase/glycosyltransferase involved in cell wall biosynthesis
MIDIIIPIFNAYDSVSSCIQSVLEHSGDEVNILLIDDASTDFRIQLYLNELTTRGDKRLKILRNSVNAGFVRSVNVGMATSANDVVLLNSDTLVQSDWVSKLAFCAYSTPMVASVTPFSNNAEICSYPTFCRNTSVNGLDTSTLCEAMQAVDDGIYPQLPTGVGYCMYIRRAAISAVGIFDAERFGHGYGEENDFCIRATQAGFKHLLCTSTYVVHHGAQSFQDQAKELKESHLQTLHNLYPQYKQEISEFVSTDPIEPFRDRIQEELRRLGRDSLGRPNLPGVLLVTHRSGGGVEKHVKDLAKLLVNHARIEILRPLPSEEIALDDTLGNRCIFDAADWPTLVNVLVSRCYVRLHIHHTLGFPLDILKLPTDLATPYDVTLHDFGSYCPQFALTTVDALYCGEPDPMACNRCVALRPSEWALSIEEWRTRMHELLIGAQRIISPSAFLSSKVKSRFPNLTVIVRPHPPRHEWIAVPKRKVKVLVLGGLSRAKGLENLLACAWHAKYHELPISFSLIGYLERGVPRHPDLPLRITGEYDDESLPELIQDERADCIWFPGFNPESYSYTLDAALASGLPIIASRSLGAVSDRLCEEQIVRVVHQLVDPGLTPAEISDLFLRSQATAVECKNEDHARSAHVQQEHYRDWVVSTWPTLPVDLWPEVDCLSAIGFFNTESSPPFFPMLGLSALFEHAIECGHRDSRIALHRQLKEIETRLATPEAASTRDTILQLQIRPNGIESLRNGEHIDFREGGNALKYQCQGWDLATSGGTWTIGPIAQLFLRLPEETLDTDHFGIEIVAQGMVGPFHPVTHAEIVVNGISLGILAFGHEQTIFLPLYKLGTPLIDGEIELNFRIIDPVSPHSLNLSKDNRALGLLLTKLQFRIR